MVSPPQIYGRFLLQRALSSADVHHDLFLMVDPKRHGPAVLKRIKPENLTEDELFHFRQKTEHALSLNHPRLVRTLEAGEISGAPYLISEWIRGKSLSTVIRTAGEYTTRIKPAVAAGIIYQALTGLAYAQAFADLAAYRSYITPSQILVSYEGVAKLLLCGGQHVRDSRPAALENETSSMQAYVAPELLSGQGDPNKRSDVYAVGAVLWHLLTYSSPPPLTEPNRAATMLRALEEFGTPSDLASITMKALRPIAKERYASAGNMAGALEKTALADEKTIARSIQLLFSGNFSSTQKEWADLLLLGPKEVATGQATRQPSGARPVIKANLTLPKKATKTPIWVGLALLLLAAIGFWVLWQFGPSLSSESNRHSPDIGVDP